MAVAIAALVLRPLLPVDETRYVSVAWEMWRSDHWLVPHLNGEPYSHKPPLLFWLIHLSWAIAGVGEMAARAVIPMVDLVNLWLLRGLAGRLWPLSPQVAQTVPWIAIGCVGWAMFATLTFFDVLLGTATLLALLGVCEARERPWRGWAVVGIALGLGLLAKGPVALVHILPVPLLAPLWLQDRGGRWAAWYGGLAGAIALGAAMGLAWALPAAQAGGAAYSAQILWEQTAGRLSESFAHGRPWWFYGPVAMALLLPWLLWPPLWAALRRWTAMGVDSGIRFCLAWAIPTLVVMSAVSGKQFYYLVPSLPALALLLARIVSGATAGGPLERGATAALFAVPLLALLAIALLPVAMHASDMGPSMAKLAAWSAVAPMVAGIVIAAMPMPDMVVRAAGLAIAGCALVLAVHVAARPLLAADFDVTPMARNIARLQDQGRLVGHVHNYHGQYHFPGRLKKPLAITWKEEAFDWAKAHSSAAMVVSHDSLPEGVEPIFAQTIRGRIIGLWPAQAVIDRTDVVER